MGTANQRHVVHHRGGGWEVRRPHAERASSLHQTQEQAQTRAKEILSRSGGGEAVTHGLDGNIRRSDTVSRAVVDWSLLSPQGHVLFYVALCPGSTASEISRAVGRTERQVRSIIRTLKQGNMLQVRPHARRHHFTVNYDAPLLHPTIEGLSLGDLMEGAVEHVRQETPDICEQLCTP